MSSRLLLFLICIIRSLVFAGQTEEDLLQQLNEASHDTSRVLVLRDLGYLFEFSDTAKAMYYYKQEYALASSLNNPHYLSMAMLDFGSVQYNIQNFEAALVFYKKSLDFALRAKDYRRAGAAYVNIGNAFYSLHQVDSSAFYQVRAIEMQEKAGDFQSMAMTYSTLAIIFEDHDRLDESLFYAKKCQQICLSIGFSRGYTGACITAAVVYRKQGLLQDMNRSIEDALAHFDSFDHDYYKASFYQNISGLYFDSEQFVLANTYADSALHYISGQDEGYMNASIWMSKGLSLIKLNNEDEGMKYLERALPIALQSRDWQVVREIYLNLSDIQSQKGNWKEAFEYNRLYTQYKDSTHTEDIAQNAAELSARFRSEKQQIELERLAKEQEVAKLETEQQRRRWWLTFIISILLITIILLMYLNQRRKTIISKQHEAIQSEQIKRFESDRQIVVLDSMLKGEENERSRVAQDLHDGLGSLLSGVKLSLSSVHGNQILSEEHARIFERSLHQLDDAISEMRRVAHNMMPESLQKYGLIEALGQLVSHLHTSGSLDIHFEHHDMEQRLASDQEITLYRIVQELINNAIKHAQCSQLIIQISRNENQIHMVVEDNGKGFDTSRLEQASGAGYRNLRNRTAYLKGKMDVQSRPGEGTSVLIEFSA